MIGLAEIGSRHDNTCDIEWDALVVEEVEFESSGRSDRSRPEIVIGYRGSRPANAISAHINDLWAVVGRIGDRDFSRPQPESSWCERYRELAGRSCRDR